MKLSLNEHFMRLNAVFQRSVFIHRSCKRQLALINIAFFFLILSPPIAVFFAKHLYNSGF